MCKAWSVRKIQPPNYDNYLQKNQNFTYTSADLPSNHITLCWMRTSASLYLWHGFLRDVLIFFFCFLSSFHFLFKFQDICPCARIAAVLFLELVCSYCTDKHWAFWRKLDFPSSLIRCCFPQAEANIYLENNRHLRFCLWKEFTLSGATCVLSETEILSPLDFSKIFLPC